MIKSLIWMAATAMATQVQQNPDGPVGELQDSVATLEGELATVTADLATISQGQLLYDIFYWNDRNDGNIFVPAPAGGELPELPPFCIEAGQSLELEVKASFLMNVQAETAGPAGFAM